MSEILLIFSPPSPYPLPPSLLSWDQMTPRGDDQTTRAVPGSGGNQTRRGAAQRGGVRRRGRRLGRGRMQGGTEAWGGVAEGRGGAEAGAARPDAGVARRQGGMARGPEANAGHGRRSGLGHRRGLQGGAAVRSRWSNDAGEWKALTCEANRRQGTLHQRLASPLHVGERR